MDGTPAAPEAPMPMPMPMPMPVYQSDSSRQPISRPSHTPFEHCLFPARGKEYDDLFPAYGRSGDDLHSLYSGPAVATHPVLSPKGGQSFNFETFLDTEFDLSRLHAIKHRLWLSGRPVPPRSLQTQIREGRELVVSDKLELHLVWGGGKIYLKPLAKYLLCSKFWDDEMVCSGQQNCQGGQSKGEKFDGEANVDGTGNAQGESGVMMSTPNTAKKEAAKKTRKKYDSGPLCKRCKAREAALGLLYSYVALIHCESDLDTAKEKGLVPKGIEWPAWRLFVHEFLSPTSRYYPIHENIAVRFIYGELRLNRLNMIYIVTMPWTLGFMQMWSSYSDFVVNNSSWIIGGTAWIVVVLSAMQVALGTDMGTGEENPSLQRASYGFAIFSMLGPLAALALLFLYLLAIFIWNLVRTMTYEKKRSGQLGREWSDLHKSRDRGKRGKVTVVDEEALTQ